MDKHTAASIASGMNEHAKRQINAAVDFDRDFGVGEASPAAEPNGHTVPSANQLKNKAPLER